MKLYSVDLAVVGAGASGLATALHALQLGVKKVLLLEKRPYPGGNAAMAGGTLFGAETALQRQAGCSFSCRAAVDDIMAHHRYDQADAALVRALVEGSAGMIDWIQALGGDYRAQAAQPIHTPSHPSRDFGHFRVVTQTMVSEIRALGGILLTQAAPDSIGPDADGGYRLSGHHKDGDFLIRAKAVSLSTGGFLGNQSLMDRFFPHLSQAPMTSDAIPLTGDGIALAESLGARLSPRCTINMHGMNSFDRCCRYPNRLGQESPLWVNRLGRRFVPEESSRVSKNDLGNAVFSQPGQVCYALFDRPRLEAIAAGDFSTPQLRKTDLSQLLQVLAGEHKRKKWVCISDDWAEIARWIGAAPETLTKTVEDYNRACALGLDKHLGKEAQFLIPVRSAPFVAVRCVPVTIDTYGPVKVDVHFRVLDGDDAPIPGLYASGVLTSGWQGSDYYPRGSSLGFSLTGGLLAAKSIRSYLNSK